MKYGLKDVTFNIPVKIDSRDRAKNLFICVNYINYYFDTNIIVCEQNDNYVPQILLNTPYIYEPFYTDKLAIHRTRQLNVMAKKSTTPIIVNYDCDVVLPVDQYIKAADMIRQGKADMVYPYSGTFLDMKYAIIEEFVKHYDLQKLTHHVFQHIGPPNQPSVGGAIYYNRQKFIDNGMENEHFIGWGYEDNERLSRFTKLGLHIARTDKPLYHMQHKLASANPVYINDNMKEYDIIKNLNANQLRERIHTWEWCHD